MIKEITQMISKDAMIFAGVSVALLGTMLGVSQYNIVKERQFKEKTAEEERKLREKKLENEKLYFDKLTPEQVENLEKEKLVLKEKEVELKVEETKLKNSETELKKTVDKFKKDIQSEIQRTTNDSIERDMRRTFDDWAGKYEDRLDKKIDRVVNRIDDLSDRYGGVKTTGSTSPSINVVNAPNN